MYLLNPGRYVVGDPGDLLDDRTLKSLWERGRRLDALALKTESGQIVAPSAGKSGEFRTSLGKTVLTKCGHVAFVPYAAAGRLLRGDFIRLTLAAPALLFHNAAADIELDGALAIYCSSLPPVGCPGARL